MLREYSTQRRAQLSHSMPILCAVPRFSGARNDLSPSLSLSLSLSLSYMRGVAAREPLDTRRRHSRERAYSPPAARAQHAFWEAKLAVMQIYFFLF